MSTLLILKTGFLFVLLAALTLIVVQATLRDPLDQRESIRVFYNLHVRPLGNLAAITWGHIKKGLAGGDGTQSLGLIQRDSTADNSKNQIRRDIEIVRDSVNVDDRTVRAILSTENSVKSFYRGDMVEEVLVHEEGSIDLSRAKSGLPLLFNHDRDRQIGIIRNLKIENHTLTADLKFSRNEFADEVFQDIKDGIRNHLSISGERLNVDESKDGVIRTTLWKPFEASVVSVAGDVEATIRRDRADDDDDDDDNVVDFKRNRDRLLDKGSEKGAKAERERQAKIRKLFARHAEKSDFIRDLMEDCIEKGTKIERASERLLEALGDELEPSSGQFTQDTRGGSLDRNSQRFGRAQAGQDQMDKFVEGATLGIMVRANMKLSDEEKKAAKDNEFRSYSLQDLARTYITLSGGKVPGNRLQMVGEAFTRSGVITHGTSDFANILQNVANKAMMRGWDEAEETWQKWSRIGTLSDFKIASRVNLSEFPTLDLIPAGAEYTYAKMLDLKETIRLFTYGKLFSINRQAIINDDLDAFTKIPAAMARSANRKIGDVTYQLLTMNSGTGPTLNQDSLALFHSTHNNLKTSSSGPPTVGRINDVRTAMALQKGMQSAADGPAVLNISPAHLIVPKALEATAKTLQEAQYDPAGSAGTLTPNIVRGTFDVIADARLDAVYPLAWYMAADQNRFDTFETAFLDGNPNPFLEEQNGWTVDGRQLKVRIDVGVAALDFRGVYKQDGD